MSANIFELSAKVRDDMGKGASRRLRRTEDEVPAVIYGGNEKPLSISLSHNKLIHALENEAFYSHILTLDIEGKKTKAILKDLQRHHYKRSVLHADFQRVKGSDVITMKVPLHFTGQDLCPGVKVGGIVNHQAIDLEVRCKVNKLPEFINVDISKLELDHAVHLSEIELPEGVELHTGQGKDFDPSVVSVHLPRQAKVDEELDKAEAEAAEAEGESEAETEDKAKDESSDVKKEDSDKS